MKYIFFVIVTMLCSCVNSETKPVPENGRYLPIALENKIYIVDTKTGIIYYEENGKFRWENYIEKDSDLLQEQRLLKRIRENL